MQRASLAALLTIALLVGFTARAIFFPSTFPAGTANGDANAGIAEAFYATLNEALSGGATEPLEALLADFFSDHNPDTGATRTADAFLDDVRAMGTSSQTFRLEPISVESRGENLVVGIDADGGEPLQVAAMTVVTESAGPYFETLRVVGGKIVERWAPSGPWLEVANYKTAAIPVPALTQVAATLLRVTIPAGVGDEWDMAGSGVLTIESGAGFWTASAMSSEREPVRLLPGEFVEFTNGEQVELRSVDDQPVTALVFVTVPEGAVDAPYHLVSLSGTEQDVAQSILWRGLLSDTDSITRYRPGRIVVPPNARLELRHAQGIDALFAIDRGVLELWSPAGTIVLPGSDQCPEGCLGAAQLDAGNAGTVVAPEAVAVQNPSDQPIALFVIAIERATVSR